MTTHNEAVRIAVDVMGGDNAPGEIIKGALQAARELGVKVLLVGDKKAIETILVGLDRTGISIRIVESTQMILDGEDPAFGVVRKPDSSIALATRLIKDGDADAVVSAGSSSATMVAAMQYLRTMPGIDRPMAGGTFLSLFPKTVVLDLGANVGVQPCHLVDFAVAGTVYAQTFLDIKDPTVGLLNVGAGEDKGNDQAREAHNLLKKSGINFIGNVEGHDIAFGKANVIVTDGFIGNILIKFCEGLGRTVGKWVSNEFKDHIDPVDLKKSSQKLYAMLRPAEVLSEGPLWGVNGVSAIAHGASKAEGIADTIRQAKQAVDSGFVEKLLEGLEKAHANISRKTG